MNENPLFDAEETPAAPTEETPAVDFPWPPSEGASVIDAFATTWRESVFHPSRFFARMPAESPLGSALLYYLILGIAVAAIGLFWGQVLPQPAMDAESFEGMFASANATTSPIVSFLISPIAVLCVLFIGAAITHVMLLLLTSERGSYKRTVRVFAFAYGPSIFAIVPWLGMFVGGIWSIVISIIGLREAHRTTTARAALAVLLPAILLGMLFVVMVLAMVAAGVMML